MWGGLEVLAGPYTALLLADIFFYCEPLRYQDWPTLEHSISLTTFSLIDYLFLSQDEKE